MNRNVGTIDVGMAKVAISVVRQSRMNSRIVSETSTAASSRWNFTSCIEFRTNRAWSWITSILNVGRQAGLATGPAAACTASETWTVLVPDCFWMNRLTAFSPLSRVRLRGSSTESSARPTSRMRIG